MFPPDFTSELRMRLDGTTMEAEPKPEDAIGKIQDSLDTYTSRFKASSFQLATDPIEAVLSATENSEGGEPMDVGSDVDGEPVDDMDGEPADDVDGEPLNDDVDGFPVNDEMDDAAGDDVDGAPINNIDSEVMDEGGTV